jgi:hypothetical protein
LVLVPVCFFVANKSLNVQNVLILVPAVHFRSKNADVTNSCTCGSYEVASEDAEWINEGPKQTKKMEGPKPRH